MIKDITVNWSTDRVTDLTHPNLGIDISDLTEYQLLVLTNYLSLAGNILRTEYENRQ